MRFIVIFSLICVLVLVISTDCGVKYLDCGESEQLCPSLEENVTVTCAISSSYLQWAINNQTMDFTKHDNATKQQGPFLARIKATISQGIESTLHFNSSLVSLGTVIKCRDNINGGQEQCQVNVFELPSAPSNLSYTQYPFPSLSWSHLDSTIDHYNITIISTNTTSQYSFVTNATVLTLKSLSVGMYTAYVKGVACQGQLIGEAASVMISKEASHPSLSTSFVPSVMSTSTMSLQTVSLTSTINISTAIVSSDTTSIVPTSSTTVTTSLNKSRTTTRSTTGTTTTIPTVTDTESNDPALIWIMLTVSGTIGAFFALLLVAIIALLLICLYRLLHHPNDKTNTIALSISQPPTTAVALVPQEVEEIQVVCNPCYKTELNASDYQIPQYIRSLDEIGFSRPECV